MVANTVQNVSGGGSSASIISIDPPPEGKAGCQIAFSIDPAIGFIAQYFQMASAQGLPLSQVMTLVIDNTANSCPVTVTHGVFREKTVVAGNALQVVPTFSNKGPYSVSAVLSPGANSFPTDAVTLTITFLNYNRPAATVSGSNGATANAPQATAGAPVTSLIQLFTAAGQVNQLFLGVKRIPQNDYPAGVYYLYNLDLTIGSATALAAGAVLIVFGISGLDNIGNEAWTINWHVVGLAAAAGVVALNQWRIWQFNPTPIIGPFPYGGFNAPAPAAFIEVKCVSMTNASVVNWTANVCRNVVLNAI